MSGGHNQSSTGSAELLALAERVEKLTGSDQELDLAIHLSVYPDGKIARVVAEHRHGFDGQVGTAWQLCRDAVCYETRNERGNCYSNGGYPLPAVTASLDAAMTLVLPGTEYQINTLYGLAEVELPLNSDPSERISRKDGNVILAFVECCLRARAALSQVQP